MRDRLIELLTKAMDEQYEKRQLITPQHTVDYLLANGVIVPPCKVGDDIYVIEKGRVINKFVTEVAKHTNGRFYFTYLPYDKNGTVQWCYPSCVISSDYLGETVFLTREAAEAKLEGGAE